MVKRKDTPAPFFGQRPSAAGPVIPATLPISSPISTSLHSSQQISGSKPANSSITTTTTTFIASDAGRGGHGGDPPRTPPQQHQRKGHSRRVSSSTRGHDPFNGGSIAAGIDSGHSQGNELHTVTLHARPSTYETGRDERVSHDLNLTDVQRQSVVESMLLSLNPDTSQSFSPPRQKRQTSVNTTGRNFFTRHVHSSSLQSNHTTTPDDNNGLQFAQSSQGRSNNQHINNNRPLGLQRIESGRQHGHPAITSADMRMNKASDWPSQAPALTSGSRHFGHRRKTSKSSGSSSVDYGQTMRLSSTTSALALGRRSTSFDHGRALRSLHSASSSGGPPLLASSMSQPLFSHHAETVGNPDGSAGQRHENNPVGYPSQASDTSGTDKYPLQRRGSGKSSKSLHLKRAKADIPVYDPANLAPRPSEQEDPKRQSRQMHSNTFTRRQNESPIRPSSDVADMPRSAVPPMSAAKETTRDRPGFFRRVFGSSKGTGITTTDTVLSSAQSTPVKNTRSHLEPDDKAHGTNRLYKPPAMEDLTKLPMVQSLQGSQTEAVPPPLTKKSSSFFRRRKKSMSESTPVPTIPSHLNEGTVSGPKTQDYNFQHDMSPTSSLRRVMVPYLDGASGSMHNTRPPMLSNPPSQASLDSRPNQAPSTEPAADSASVNKISLQDDHHPTMLQNAHSAVSKMSGDEDKLHYTAQTGHGFTSSQSGNNAEHLPTLQAAPKIVSSNHDGTTEHEGRLRAQGGKCLNADKRNNAGLFNTPDAHSLTKSTGTIAAGASAAKVGRGQAPPSPPPVVARESLEAHTSSPSSDIFHSATSTVHPLRKDGLVFPETDILAASEQTPTQLTSDETDIRQARALFAGDETLMEKSAAAAWLGEPGPARTRIREAYMGLYEWQDISILAALRILCGRLYLKGESQQVDRILDTFSNRWCACNPSHGFKAVDVVHTICYSVLLLNTDLHQAGIETKMTRGQFLRNIMPTIRRVVLDAAPDAFVNKRASTLPPFRAGDQRFDSPLKSPTLQEHGSRKNSLDSERPTYKLSSRSTDLVVNSRDPPLSPLDYNTKGDCGPLVKQPFHGKLSSWESQIEIVLKDFFYSVREQPLPIFGAEPKGHITEPPPSSTSLSVPTHSQLRRSPSTLSKAGSENQGFNRGRMPESRLTSGRWTSKTRSRPRMYASSTVASSRRSSFDEQSSVTNPSITSAWSRFSSLGRTQTTMSTDSFGSSFPPNTFQQSIGFANALSQAIIREEGTTGEDESLRAAPLLEDESLELHGAPWAKEGMLKHKHHLETVDKKTKHKTWVETFAVIEKGHMRLFSFNMNAKSLRAKAKTQRAAGGVVGGGNWADNAETLASFPLRQIVATALPEPGYSTSRPHVWALSLPTGAVHLFQCGTPDIVREFVMTANYWSARLSKEPLVGGVSNIEYGWSDSVINSALIHPLENLHLTPSLPSSVSGPIVGRPSLHSSIRSARSSVDHGSGGIRPKLPGDKITVNDWTPPPQSLFASALMEVDQLKALSNYVQKTEEELQKHNELRGAVLLAYSPRHPNSNKAMRNWEMKSNYLLRELIKFNMYIEALQEAQKKKEGIYASNEGEENDIVVATDNATAQSSSLETGVQAASG